MQLLFGARTGISFAMTKINKYVAVRLLRVWAASSKWNKRQMWSSAPLLLLTVVTSNAWNPTVSSYLNFLFPLWLLYLGVTISRVLHTLEVLDRHCFDRSDSSNSMETLYHKIFWANQNKDNQEVMTVLSSHCLIRRQWVLFLWEVHVRMYETDTKAGCFHSVFFLFAIQHFIY